MIKRAGAFLAASVLALVLPAQAAAARGHVGTSGSVQLASDYRYRGVSLSNGHAVVQGDLEAERDGWFVGGWASLSGGGSRGSEADLLLGRRGLLGELHYSVSAQAHLFNNAGDPRSIELVGAIGRQIGPAAIDVELAYAPRQAGNGKDNVYAGARIGWAIPATPVSVQLRGGIEDGFYRSKLDWEAGLSAPVAGVTVSASLVGTAGGGDDDEQRGTGLILTVGRSW